MKKALNARALLSSFGSSRKVSERLEAAGLAFASVRAIERWKARNSIPSHRLTALLLLAERDGARLDLYQYLTPGGR